MTSGGYRSRTCGARLTAIRFPAACSRTGSLFPRRSRARGIRMPDPDSTQAAALRGVPRDALLTPALACSDETDFRRRIESLHG